LEALAESTGPTKKQVASLIDALTRPAATDLGKNGPGVFRIPGLVKIKVINKRRGY
jgi:hypothetical protein